MNILITGSTGFIGSALTAFLGSEGHSVTRLVRRRPPRGKHEVLWDPDEGTIDEGGLAGVEAAVHLAGHPIAAGRWTARRKEAIRSSRAEGTRLLSETLARLDPPPRVLACASAKDYYGDRGDELLGERSDHGPDFLADVIRQWEDATEAAALGGIRVVNLRFGIVLGRNGGALKRFLTPFRLGVGGRLGSGRQYISWVSLEDVTRAIYHSIVTESIEGPVNIVAPDPVTNAQFTRTLGRVLSRPTLFPVPGFALRILFGEVVDSLLSSQRMDSTKLLESGFKFRHPELEGALRGAVGKS